MKNAHQEKIKVKCVECGKELNKELIKNTLRKSTESENLLVTFATTKRKTNIISNFMSAKFTSGTRNCLKANVSIVI